MRGETADSQSGVHHEPGYGRDYLVASDGLIPSLILTNLISLSGIAISTHTLLGISGRLVRQRLQMDRRVVEPNVTVIFEPGVGYA